MTPLRTRGRKPTALAHTLRRRLESLEDRLVSAAISIADATAIEGSTAIRLIDRFVSEGSGGINHPRGLVFGPDGNHDGAQDLYVVGAGSDAVHRYDGQTGAPIDTFVPPGSGGLDAPVDLAFGADGHLYVSSETTGQVLRYDGSSGAFLGVVAGGLSSPHGLMFDTDGSLYIANQFGHEVLRYQSGALNQFVSPGSGGLVRARESEFGPDGNGDGGRDLYVAIAGAGKVLRYDGLTGAFIDEFATVPPGLPGSFPNRGLAWLQFGNDGYLYTTARTTADGFDTSFVRFNAVTGAFVDTLPLGRDGWSFLIGPDGLVYDSSDGGDSLNFVERFGHASLAAFTVSLDAPSASPVTVQFATAGGTATAGSDFLAASGTLTFSPGQTTRTILVRTLNDALSEGAETFVVTLSNASGAALVDAQGAGTIFDDEPFLPRVGAVAVNGGVGAQRSRVTAVTVTFNAAVTFAGPVSDAFALARIGGGPVGSFTAMASVVNGVTVVTLADFTGAETQFGSLADGRYALVVRAAQVSANGQPLDGNGDGTGGDDYALAGSAANGLYRLYGDVTGDGTVNAADFGPFRGAFGSAVGQAAYVEWLDVDGDGFINAFDFAQFRSRFGSSVP